MNTKQLEAKKDLKMLTLERPQLLVNEYPTFYVPRTTLGIGQGGSVKRLCFY